MSRTSFVNFRSSIAVNFVLLFALLAGMGYWGYRSASIMQALESDLHDNIIFGLRNLRATNDGMDSEFRAINDALNGEISMQAGIKGADDSRAAREEAWRNYTSGPLDEVEKVTIAKMEALFAKVNSAADKAKTAMKASDRKALEGAKTLFMVDSHLISRIAAIRRWITAVAASTTSSAATISSSSRSNSWLEAAKATLWSSPA